MYESRMKGSYNIEKEGRIKPIQVEYVDHMGGDKNVVNAARVSFDKFVETVTEKDAKLLDYLARNNHWSPFAHTSIIVRCRVPLFLARQLVKHQVGGAWNEESRRYISTAPDYYIPEKFHYAPTANKKQGRGDTMPETAYNKWVERLLLNTSECDYCYDAAIEAGMAPEEARMFLPQNTLVNYIWNGSALFFARVIQQRLDSHAQLAANEFARKLWDVVYPLYPASFNALLKELVR